MRGRIFGGLVVVAVMAIVVGSGAPPALAQTTWSVTNPNADGSLTSDAGTLTVTNADNGITISCSSSTLYGEVPTAAGVEEVGRLDFVDSSGCTGPGVASPGAGLVGPLYLVGESYDPSAGRATLEAVEIYDPLYVSEAGCDYYANAGGSFGMTYTNATGRLVIDGATFTVTEAVGSACSGVAEVGDTLELSATYTVSPAVTMVAAAPRFTVSGSSPDGGFTTTQSDATVHTLGDLDTGNHSLCSTTAVAGRIPNGTDLSGAGIGSVTSAPAFRCSMFPYTDGTFTVTPVNLPWRLDAASYVATDGGVVSGSIPNFGLSASGPGCSFSVTATPTGRDWRYGQFNGRPDVLVITLQGAEITNVQGCGGYFNDGDQASYSTAYAVSPATLTMTAR